MASLDSTGLTTATQAEIQASIEADERAEISTTLDVSTSSPLGQLNRIVSRAIALQEEALAAVYNGIDPDTAAGDALFRLRALTGTIREPATRSRFLASLDLDAGTYAAGALVLYWVASEQFVNIAEVVAPGGAVDVVFEAEDTGPIVIDLGSEPTIVAVAGWNSILDASEATTGQAIETEAAFRQRANAEVESPGSSSPSGIVADLTREISGIVSAFVVENDTDATVDSIPPHAIEVVIFGPTPATADDNDAAAEQILASKAAGIGTYGNTTRTVYDDEDQPHAISFTRPVVVDVSPVLTVGVSATAYAGDDALAKHVAERAAAVYVPGLNAAWSQVVGWAMEVAGVLRVSAVDLGGGAFTDVAITTRQIAAIAEGDITITSTEVTP